MRFGLLGLLQVDDGAGSMRQVAGARQRALLAALLVRVNRVVPAQELAEIVWDGTPPAAAAALRNQVMRLRRALGEDSAARITAREPGYVITLSTEELDITLFEALHREAGAAMQAGRWRKATGVLDQALALWRGAALLDVGSQALRDECGERLEQLRVQAMEWQVDAGMRLGHHEQLVLQLRDLVRAYPLREQLHGQLLLALYRCGRQAEALEAYQSARSVLSEELGTEPGTALQALHQQILAADPALAVPERALPASRGRGLAVPLQLPGAVTHFAGRAAELEALTALLDQADEPGPATVVISAIGGTAGVGKTALAVHWAHQIAGRFPDGQLYANLRGYDPAGGPALAADVARRFLNTLGIPDSQIPSDPESLASLYRSSLADKQMLIVLDNARDAAQVRPLLPGGPGCFVLITSRSQLTSLAASEGAHMLTVDLLSLSDACELVARRLGRRRVEDEPEAVSELVELCARLPIAVSIAAARAAARPALPLADLVTELRDAGSRLDMLDAGDPGSSVRAVFSWSYQKLSADAARMFRLLSMHPGPDITIPAAASLAGLTHDQARRAVGELSSSHLLAEHNYGRFTFHDLLRAYAADQSRVHDEDADRNAAMHRLLDHYLHTGHEISRLIDPTLGAITLAPPQPGALPEMPGDYEQAWAWAEAEYQVLLAVASQAAATHFATYAWQILRVLEPFIFRRGLWHEFIGAQCTALDVALRMGDKAGQAHMHRGLGRVYSFLGSFEEAESHLSCAIAEFRTSGNRSDEARAHINMGVALRVQGRYADALSQARQALRLYRTADHPAGQAGAINNIGLYHIFLGNYQEAVACCQKALSEFSEIDNRHGVAHALDSLGYAYHFLGQHAQAIACYQQSLEAFRKHGDQRSEADTLTHLGDTHHATGNPQAARRSWEAALNILSELRHHPDASLIRAKLAGLGNQAVPL